MRPIYQDIMGLGAFGVLLGGVPALVPIGAMGGSFANLILLYQGSDVLNNVRRVVTSNLTSRNDPLLVYEISYVLLKRYLPRKLQEKIVFIKEDSKAPHKLKFVLDLKFTYTISLFLNE